MAELSRPIDREFNVEVEGGRFSTSFLNDLVDTHVNKIAPRYVKFQKLYEGKHKIQNRPRKDKNKPNNKLVNDFFGQTIDNTVGYFLGNPIVLNYTEPKKDKAPVEADPADVGVDLTELEDTAVQDELDKICSENDKDDLFIEWGKEAMIKGLSHILVYQDEESHTKMMRVSPEDLIVVYKNSSTKEPAYKIRLYDIDTEDTKKTTHYAEVYSPTKIETFKCVDDGSCGATGKGKARQFASYEFVKEEPHIFGRIPIITVYNNEEQMSDLEKIETLVNDYDKVLSDVSNEFEAFRNAYLMLKNMTASGDNIQKLKDEGIIEVMENGDVKFVTKEIQTEALENHLNRLEKNIHKFSAVPDLSDENFAGNLSGVAIRFKLFGLETKCIIKERKMEKAIKELVRVLSVPIHVNTGREVDVLNLKVEFSRNVPNNLTEIVDTVTKLDGKVDKETLLSLLPFIDNPRRLNRMGLPDIIIEFSKKAVTAIQNGSTGIVGIMLKDAKNKGAMVLRSVDEIPTGDSAFSAENTAYIERAFIGSPSKVIIYTMDKTAESYDEATKYFATQKVNYIVGAPDLTTEEATKLATWVKGIRKNSVRRPVAVLPKTAGDSRGVINFEVVNSSATDKIEVGEKQYTEAEYCSRIAGLLAGLDLRVSATYKPLTEVTAIPLVDSDEEVDTAIDAGKLTLYNDGERVVIARGVNSLTTVTEVETADLQKIKINAIQDQIEGDIYSTINKSYIGNYSNSYDNKCLLITAIKGYLRGLEATEGGKGWLKADGSTMEINVAKQKQYLESIGVDTSEMDEQAIKEANTGSHVFLKGTISILDAIEDVDIFINKD